MRLASVLCDLGDPDAAARMVLVLSRGGVVIMPCDTIYGIVGIVPDTEDRIRDIKGREQTKPFIQLIGEPEWLERLGAPPIPTALERYWPGPLTLVVRVRHGGTAGVRVPADPFLRKLLTELDTPLYSTSVNRSGEPALAGFDDMRKTFEDAVDLIVRGDVSGTPRASTVLDTTTSPFRIVRQGEVHVPAVLLGEGP